MDPPGAVVCHLCDCNSSQALEAAVDTSLLCGGVVGRGGRDLFQLSAAVWRDSGLETAAMPGCAGAQPGLFFAWGIPKTFIPRLTDP